MVATVFDTLRTEAQGAKGYSDYLALKKRICAMNDSVLHDDMRSTLSADIVAACGKEIGLSKSEIKKAFCFGGGGCPPPLGGGKRLRWSIRNRFVVGPTCL